ncbi:thioesterase-like superfamily-domain-containing protein [Pseudomassariella vexata]|uniref:Thioesterase-like superfamily-domain-containing protein n=1 Tax=Pseudomassariella vexata TaxID=1141098 RepID=A0A1Y2DT59_9PEZI|nr:thioesterase-like superfamily-domain-containing protein [Pseudomassariella vexata]ORY62462.1 thioesterase-like superfamily-domain-containing protein [Pseudomassariella vexata]
MKEETWEIQSRIPFTTTMTTNIARDDADRRLTFQEALSIMPIPDRVVDGHTIKRYMSLRSAWFPGIDLPVGMDDEGVEKPMRFPSEGRAAYGGHVYSQAGLAASKAFEDMLAGGKAMAKKKEFGIHTMHGYFSEAGIVERPFIYEVACIAANPSFHNLFVTARQPTRPSTNPQGDHFPIDDAELPLGPVCFNSLVSFRPAGLSQLDAQEASVQARFSNLLRSRPPAEWDPAPLTDIDVLKAALGPTKEPGSFPIVDMKKVDLTTFNSGKPLHERRELLLYRLLAPLPASNTDAHILTHAFEADRNGLLMVGNHCGFGFEFGKAASLSYSFVVHVNPKDTIMQYKAGIGIGMDEWWIQEASFPRVEAGRAIIMSKIWSPTGVHVATEYQDGILRRAWRDEEREKL